MNGSGPLDLLADAEHRDAALGMPEFFAPTPM